MARSLTKARGAAIDGLDATNDDVAVIVEVVFDQKGAGPDGRPRDRKTAVT